MKSHSRSAGLAAALMAAALMGACNRAPDPADRLERELKSANIDNVNVDYDRNAKIVHLKGAVDSPTMKERAEEIAYKAVGTSGTVANELTVEGVDDRTADDMDNAIRKELNATVNNDRTLAERDVNFDVNNGVVTIKGQVRSEAEKKKVGEFAQSTANVKEVVNALEIKPVNGPATAGRPSTTPGPGAKEAPERNRSDERTTPSRR
jgi:hyperosmotically inducible protein